MKTGPGTQARVRRQRYRESKRNAGMVPAEIWLPKTWRDAVIARGETLQDAAQKAFQLLIAHWKSNQASSSVNNRVAAGVRTDRLRYIFCDSNLGTMSRLGGRLW